MSDNDSESGDSDKYCYAVKNKDRRNPVTKLMINNRNVKFTVDTGSSVNVIDQGPVVQKAINFDPGLMLTLG